MERLLLIARPHSLAGVPREAPPLERQLNPYGVAARERRSMGERELMVHTQDQAPRALSICRDLPIARSHSCLLKMGNCAQRGSGTARSTCRVSSTFHIVSNSSAKCLRLPLPTSASLYPPSL